MARIAQSRYQGGALDLDQPDPRGPVYKSPDEACPHPRPFEPDFHGCPAYVPVVYTPEDMRGEPMRPVLTCAHSLIGRRRGERYRFFPACALGTVEDRLRRAAEEAS